MCEGHAKLVCLHMYAKGCRLYLQMMMDLPNSHPWLYRMFAEHGLHAVRRSARFWGGLSTDLVIEQTLMKAVKSRGGLTHGRGIDEGVRTVWVQSMHQCASTHMVMANLTGLFRDTSQQHREFG